MKTFSAPFNKREGTGHAPRVERLPLGVPRFTPMFRSPDAFAVRALDLLPRALDAILPLSTAHRRDLPLAVRDLSTLLTSDRGGFGRPYWSSPRFVSAYLRFFLPWNLVRLSRVFPSLRLPVPQEGALYLDIGSGPLTVPLALWISRPDWRRTPVRLVCADTVPHPMDLGRKLFEALAEVMETPQLWSVELKRLPLVQAVREIRRPRLLTAGNVLNELRSTPGMSSDARIADLAEAVAHSIPDAGAAFFVEPGTRLGGTVIARLREAALEEGFTPVFPCPHDGECPLLDRRERGWCHFNLDIGGPSWLAALSQQARLRKTGLSLSPLLLSREEREDVSAGEVRARVLSDAFRVPGRGFCRYACSEKGWNLIPHAESLPFGALTDCEEETSSEVDRKSGASLLFWKMKSLYADRK
ncbi:MAG: small ribosomal subunit Rsm22 family protein [Desulfovibrionaceae bacterium]|nr:small ribosomal subunit Rsm22 family protein [Desulfovibrionaceae bacterium]